MISINTTKKTVKFIIAVLLILLLIMIFLPPFITRSNCGGNLFALSQCRTFVAALRIEIQDHNNPIFSIRQALNSSGDNLGMYGFQSWGVKDFWIFNPDEPIKNCDGAIIICVNEFDNVPRPTVFNLFMKNRAHAAAKIDGIPYLISPNEYQELDKSNYIKATELFEADR